jgi:hypothetical protein
MTGGVKGGFDRAAVICFACEWSSFVFSDSEREFLISDTFFFLFLNYGTL